MAALRQLQQEFSATIRKPKPVEGRMEIYRYAYFARIEESMREDFPAVAKIMGRSKFASAVRSYLDSQPLRYSSLAEVGQGFAGFLNDKSLSKLAEWEWNRIVADLKATPLTRKTTSPHQVSVSNDISIYKTPRGSAYLVSVISDEVELHKMSVKKEKVLTALIQGKTIPQVTALMQKLKIQPKQAFVWFETWAAQGIIQGASHT